MSNPFDQFAGTLTAALPPQPSDNASVAGQSLAGHSQALTQAPPQQFSLMAQPSAEKKPVMNAPMSMQPQQGMMNGGMYGQQQAQIQQAPPQGMYGGGPPPPQQQQQGMMMMQPSNSVMGQGFMAGSLTNGAPQQNGAMAGALVPSSQQSNPYALGPMAPHPPQQQLQGQPAAQSNALVNPFGQQPPQHQQQQMQQANPFGSMTGQQPPMQVSVPMKCRKHAQSRAARGLQRLGNSSEYRRATKNDFH